MWPLWVNIDYTAVSQLSGATRAEHSRALCCFLKGSNIWPNPSLGPALTPAGALLSAVHISMCGSASGSGFPRLLLGAVRPSRQQHIWMASWKLKSLRARGFLRGTDWPTPKLVWQCVLHPHLHTCHRTGCARLNESSLLTSSADKRDVTSAVALSANHWAGPWNRISKTLLWKT